MTAEDGSGPDRHPAPALSPEDRVKRRLLEATLHLPPRVRRAMAGPPPRNRRGVPLDEDLHWILFLDRLVDGGSPRDVPGLRADLERSVRIVERRPPAVARVAETTLAGRPARRFAAGDGPAPLLLFLHGGGWAAGSLDSHDGFCRLLCADTGWVVLSLDYGLAPERPFPAGLEDAIGATREVLRRAEAFGGRPDQVVLGGDSAGGNLTVATLLALRDAGEALPALQVWIYPGTDLRRSTPSHEEFRTGFVLTRATIDRYLELYGAELLDPRASVLLADLRGLPPVVAVTAGFDPLRDEGEQLVEKARAAGVPVVHLDAASLAHGFVHLTRVVPAADREVARLTRAMVAALPAT